MRHYRRPRGHVAVQIVTRKITERGFGFIGTPDGASYFFHLTDLQAGLDFYEVDEGIEVEFEVRRPPGPDGRAGAAQCVRRHDAGEPEAVVEVRTEG